MINIFARCLIRFPVVTVWRVATATQDRGGWAGWRGGVLASRCCSSRWKLVLAAASCHGATAALAHNTCTLCTGDLLGRRMQNSGQCGQHAMQWYLPVTGPGLLGPWFSWFCTLTICYILLKSKLSVLMLIDFNYPKWYDCHRNESPTLHPAADNVFK